MKILQRINEKHHRKEKSFAVLIDPDKIEGQSSLNHLINIGIESEIDFFFVGGSFLTNNNLKFVVRTIKDNCNIPVVLFPGHNSHIDFHADGLLFLSLISGRNPEFLIGQHVVAAPYLKNSNLEIIPTGYMLINDQANSSAAYVSNTLPIPFSKGNLAASTAMAGELLGMQLIYMDAGSGSESSIPPEMIEEVRKSIDIPLIIGGGISNVELAIKILKAGADIIVVGNGIEKEPELMIGIAEKVIEFNKSLKIH